ncbi:unnamed protein product, partial [Mesorhabditis belari]|uniref:Uncharacterized protein n=1 Tax=Mesorhabditis belari TaxID=2138241 RepID=A0AAF3EHJ0_9BILA
MNADLLQHLSHFNEVASSSGLKIAQPESTLGTSTTIVAVESIPEKEVVAEEPKKLGFPGIDLKTWEATEWPNIQKRQQEAMAQLVQKRQEEDMTLLQEKLTKSQAEKDEKPKETKFPGIDLKTWEETEWPIIQKRQQQEAMTRILEKLAKSQAEKAVTMEKQEALAKSQAEKDEKPQEMKFSGIDLKIWEATEWSIIQKRQQEAMAQLVQKRQEGDMTLLQEKFTKSQAEKDEKPKETKFPGIDLKVWEATEWPIIKKRQEEEAKQQQMQEQDDNINNDNVSVHSAPPLTPNIEWPLEEEEDNNVNVATASIDPSAATCTEDEADNVSVQTAIEIPQTVLTMPVDMRKLKRGDLIIAQWDAAHDAYSVPSFGSRKYFVNEESLKENQIPRYLRCFHATVQRIDLCRVRKVENRYRLPVGTEICRIHLTPASAQSVFDGAVSQ